MKKKIFLGLGLVGGISILFFTYQNLHSVLSKKTVEVVEVDSVGVNVEDIEPETLYGIPVDTLEVDEKTVRRNENLSEILREYNVSNNTIHQLSQIPRDTFDVRKIKVRNPYTVFYSGDSTKTARCLVYHKNAIEYVVLDLRDSLKVYNGKNKVDTLNEYLTGTIEYSLYQTIIDEGGSPILVNELADVYAWEIDFFGLQKGDAFKVKYERYEVNGEPAGIGKIESAWFEHMGAPYYAVKYDQGEGDEYFDEEGKSLRKTFLKAPLKFNRISSKFSHSRLHPVLKIRRPHHGVDYAAPIGTPVVAVGDGIVTKAKYSGGAGKMVKIKHNSNYQTAYLHLSRYGKGIKPGVKVKQGQVIGYVGSTGLSTGPHLDFRFYKNGKPVDPLKIDPPSANPIKEEVMAEYMPFMKEKVKELDLIVIQETTAEVL